MRVLSGLVGTGCIIGALLGTVFVFAGEGADLTSFSGDTGLVIGIAGVLATLATGVFALAYAITGERTLVYPHLAIWATVAVGFGLVYASGHIY